MQLNEQFLRMQKLAGIQPVNNEYDLVLEGVNIFINIFSSKLLTEAKAKKEVSSIIDEATPEVLAFYKALGITYDKLDDEGKKLLVAAFKEIQTTKPSAEEVKSKLLGKVPANEAEEDESKGVGAIGKLGNWLRKSTIGKVVTKTVAFLLIAIITVPLVANTVKILTPDATSNVVQSIQSNDNASTGNNAYFPAEQAKTNASNVGVPTDNGTLVVPFELSKGNEAGIKDPKIIDNYINALKAKYSDGSVSGKITVAITSYASNTKNAEKSTTSESSLSQERGETIKSMIPKKIGNVTIEANVVKGDYKNLSQETGKDATNGAVVAIDQIEADLTTTKEKTEPDKLIPVYNPLYAKYDVDPIGSKETGEEETGEEKTGEEETTGKKATGEKATGEKATNVTPTNAKQDLYYFPKLNRNGQLAVILKTISPKTDIFSKLGKETTSFTDTELTDEKITDDTTKKIAQVIINSRKNPDAFLKKMSQLAGITFGTRAKAVMAKPGQKYQPSSQIQQENITLLSLLNEAQIDDLFTSLEIKPEQVQQYKVEIAAFLGSMYANDKDKTLSILDTNSLTSEELTKLKNLGFSPQGAKGEYVWLGDKTKDQIQKPSADLKIKNPEQADSNKTGELIDKNPTLKAKLKVIKTPDQLGDLIFGIVSLFTNKSLKTFAKQKTMFSILYSRVNTEFPNANRLKQAFTKAKDKFNATYPNATDYKEETQDQDPTAIKTAQTDASKKEKSFTQDTTVLAAFTAFNSSPALTAAIQRNNTEEEVYQLILRYLIPYLGPYFYSQKDDSEGTYNRGEGGQFAKKTLKETPLNEQFLRMQKLAGLITESQYQARKK